MPEALIVGLRVEGPQREPKAALPASRTMADAHIAALPGEHGFDVVLKAPGERPAGMARLHRYLRRPPADLHRQRRLPIRHRMRHPILPDLHRTRLRRDELCCLRHIRQAAILPHPRDEQLLPRLPSIQQNRRWCDLQANIRCCRGRVGMFIVGSRCKGERYKEGESKSEMEVADFSRASIHGPIPSIALRDATWFLLLNIVASSEDQHALTIGLYIAAL